MKVAFRCKMDVTFIVEGDNDVGITEAMEQFPKLVEQDMQDQTVFSPCHIVMRRADDPKWEKSNDS